MICTTIWLAGKRKKIVETNEQLKSKSMKNTPGPDQALLSPFSVFFNLQRKINYLIRESVLLKFLDLSTKLSKDSISALWWAIVGLTDQWISKKILEGQYTANVFRHGLQNNALRYDEFELTINSFQKG